MVVVMGLWWCFDGGGGDGVCGDGDDGGGGDRVCGDDGGGAERACGDGSNDDNYISLDFSLLKALNANLITHHAYICI